ncbi:hypothetical protein D9611_000938 [Ephemerocybe angulata]|uniref:G domain-containing protein n=1 Tax=Ephemerocybe angulata TaxID=980116 RepID=A0A8H5BP85_9AGAR|nr:hypothetical protein D9611_000938 [Tulosesus angulatus]
MPVVERDGCTIVVIGKVESGKTTFIQALSNSSSKDVPGPPDGEEEDEEETLPTLSITEHIVSLPDGRSLTFLDTPGFDGFEAGGEPAKSRDDILRMLEEYIASNLTVSHVLVLQNSGDVFISNLASSPRRVFERLFQKSQVISITTRWDEVYNDEGAPVSAEEAGSKEEGLYAEGREGGSFLTYLQDSRKARGEDIPCFRSGLPMPEDEDPTSAYLSPKDVIYKVFNIASGSDLEEKLAAMTKERDELEAKYKLLLQQNETTTSDAAPGMHVRRTRRQRLLDTINRFSAQVLSMADELEREAEDVSEECKTNRTEREAASTAAKAAEKKLAEEREELGVVVEEYAKLRKERDGFKEEEKNLRAELERLQNTSSRRSARAIPGHKQRLEASIKAAQTSWAERVEWMAAMETEYQKCVEDAEKAAAEVEGLKRVERMKDRTFNEWLTPESQWLSNEQENARVLEESLDADLDIMRKGLLDSWEGNLSKNVLFLEGLNGHTVNPVMLERPGDWAPAMEAFYESEVSLALTKDMIKFHSEIHNRLKKQTVSAWREWKKGVEDIFGQQATAFDKSSLPQLEAQEPVAGSSTRPTSLYNDPRQSRQSSIPSGVPDAYN